MKSVLLFLLIVYSLSAEESDSKVALAFEAKEAVYDGKQIALSGDVYLEHEIGTLSAGQALLTGATEDKKIRLNQLDLYQNVKISLREGGELDCAEAHVSQATHLGEFSGSPAQPYVVYMEQCRDSMGSNQRLPIILKSRFMVVEFNPENGSGSPKSHINAVIAKENVTVDYNHDFIAAADRATFHREEESLSEKGLAGIIRMHADGPEGHCHVTNRNGDLIHAHQIFVDTLHRRLTFAHPKGALFTLRKSQKERIDFSSDTLNWDEQKGALNMRGNVSISQKGFGQLTAKDEITLFHSIQNGRKEVSRIEARGPTTLTHPSVKGEGQTLQSSGSMIVDHAHLNAILDSKLAKDGSQVVYRDHQGTLYADHIEVKYDLVKGKISPTKVTLTGEVKMVGKPAHDPQKLQYALADRVEIFPFTQEALLTADKGKRVLFFDQINDLKVSAPGIKIKRDEATKKDSIQGLGDVRFNFQDPEFERLYKRFEQLQKQVEQS